MPGFSELSGWGGEVREDEKDDISPDSSVIIIPV